MRLVAVLACVPLAIAELAPVSAQAPPATGIIAGTVTLQPPPPPRRSAQRYPGGQAEVRQVQQLPAVAYLVGTMPGAAPGGSAPRMTQRDTAFAPPVVHVPVGGSVAFPNDDSFFHNVFSYSSAQRFDLGRYPQGESKDVMFEEAGIVEVFCEVHEFMRGAIVVTENPFFTVVREDWTFQIEGVPEGEHTIAFWQQDHQALERRVVVASGGTTRVEVELRR